MSDLLLSTEIFVKPKILNNFWKKLTKNKFLSTSHQNYLQSVNNLSIKNIGLTGKNPSVACLIVDYSKSSKGIILSYGLTSKNGRPHAEINALKKISRNKINNKTVMYISLEPCFKKSSCCAKAIVKAGIKQQQNDAVNNNF